MNIYLRATFTFLILVIATVTNASAQSGKGAIILAPSGEQIRSISTNAVKDYPPGRGIVPDLAQTSKVDSSIRTVTRTDPVTGVTIDSQGFGVPGGSTFTSGFSLAGSAAINTARITIDRMTFGATYYEQYYPNTGLVLFGPAKTYFLSDGSSWSSGAGSYASPRAAFDRAEILGTTIRYYFRPPAEGFVYDQTDYNAGDHSSNGSLGAFGPLVIEATLGSNIGTMRGEVKILTNTPANYSEPKFNYWSAPVGAIAPFDVSFTLLDGGTFTPTTFDSTLRIENNGTVNFTAARRPPHVAVEVVGTSQVPADPTITLNALAINERDKSEDVTDKAIWTVSPASAATINAGTLATSAQGCAGVELELRATFTIDGVTRTGTRNVLCRVATAGGADEAWETYQGDERHTGYVPISLDPGIFTLRWSQRVAPGFDLNPVTAADGKVYVSTRVYFSAGDSLFVLDARDGQRLWSRDFGPVYSVNPPAYAYGNVYIQTGNHSNDTYLWAFDASTGKQVFKSPHAAQWERYFAPTIYQGEVYVNGGYYGGMYAFNAFSGASLWFKDLPQYDQFTPAVDANYVYAYVGEYAPALYVVDRKTGQEAFRIPDPNFSWNGWSMILTPVLGSQNDALVIHNGRLIKFDVSGRKIGFELPDGFSGQPSVAKGVIYAINNGGVEARSESDGSLRWRWKPVTGDAMDHLIVTDTHVLARTNTHTYAIGVLSGEEEWSYPQAGHMALAEGTLYIAAQDTLTAISMPAYIPSPASRLEIIGPVDVPEYSTASYTANVYYGDGRVRDRTRLTEWEVDPGLPARIDADGKLTVGELLSPTVRLQIRARYKENGVEVSDSLVVNLRIGVSEDEFIDRNIQAAIGVKRLAIAALEEAELRESAAIAVIKGQAADRTGAKGSFKQLLMRLKRARFWTLLSRDNAQRGVDVLQEER